MSRLYDLHTHSYCSDGQLSPSELVKLAIANNVGVLALTDHDTLGGVEEALSAAGQDIEVIPGIELSAVWQGRSVHIVGLQFDIHSPDLQVAIKHQSDSRTQRAQAIGQRLEKAGIRGALAGASHYSNGDSIGRPHFAQYLIDAGYVDSFAQAFKRYLGAGKVGDVKQHWPSMEAVIAWVVAAGGIAVLAHPDKYELTRTKLYALLQDFVTAGGRAIEVVSGQQEPTVTQKLLRAAQDFSLLASCGSDFHSTENIWQAPGRMSPLPLDCQPVWDAWQ